MAADTAIKKTTPRTIEVGNSPHRRSSWTYRPSVDIFDTADELVLVADVPGATPEGIDVSIESGILTVQAEVAPRHNAHAECLAHEFGVGSFHRRFEVDDTIDAESVAAEYRNGSLTVRLPKAQQAKRRRIPVSA